MYIYIYIYIYIYPQHRECLSLTEADERNINVIMKTMSPPGYHDNGSLATRLCGQVHELPQSHCGDNQEGTLFSS